MINEKEKEVLQRCITLEDFLNIPKKKLNTMFKQDVSMMLSDANKFLGGSNDVLFKVFNLPHDMTCPEKTPTCTKWCYEASSERRNADVLLHRKRNLVKSLQHDFVENMYNEIISVGKNELKENQQLYIRIHASGDFYSEEYLRKWFEIALKIKEYGADYVFTAYTKSLEFLDKVMKDKVSLDAIYQHVYGKVLAAYKISDFNVQLIASIMDDTVMDQVTSIINEYKLPQYVATDKCKWEDFEECPFAEDACATCMICYNSSGKNVFTKLRK